MLTLLLLLTPPTLLTLFETTVFVLESETMLLIELMFKLDLLLSLPVLEPEFAFALALTLTLELEFEVSLSGVSVSWLSTSILLGITLFLPILLFLLKSEA
jgi:hypothetical protein